MKIDSSIYFRKPTNIKRLKQLSGKINFCVADFYGIYDDGYAVKEVETFKKLVSLMRKSKRKRFSCRFIRRIPKCISLLSLQL